MRYEDTSGIGSPDSSHEPIARADVDILPPGTYGPATGNAISGAGTNSGAAGADTPGTAPTMIVAVHGAGGETTGGAGGFQALGQYGALSIDAQGNFNYVRNAGTPDGVKDVFQYTLADSAGATSSTTLTIDIAQVAAAAAGQAVVALPAGVEMSDIHVNGRDLVIDMPDGTQMVIPNGAVFVPQLAIGDVEVPSANLAALLIDSEPQPAAGPPQSSGGNFADPVPLLDPGAPLGDLIPPTELTYSPPDFHEVNQFENTKPTVIIETPDNPAGAVNAVDSVDESGLPARTIDGASEPEGTLAPQDIETTTGTIVFTAQDGLDNVTVNNVAIAAVGQEIVGAHGILTITSIDLASGQIGYTYTATDNTTDGVDDFENFTVIVTDRDGDTATGTLHIDIADDEPIARNDTDSTDLVTHVATGNVMTGADTTSGAPGADTVGADDASLTAVSSNNTGASNSSFDGSGNLVVEGEFGTLEIKADGSYVYTAHQDAPGGSSEVFTYTLTDGDGDPAQATLTLTNPDHMPTTGENPVVQLDDDALAGGNAGGVGDDADSAHTTGTLSASGGDGALGFALSEDGAPDGFTYSLQANGNLWVMQGSTHVLTITVDSATGVYSVTQVAAIDHPVGDAENNVEFDISYKVTDSDGDPATGHLTVNVDDDTPVARNDTDGLDSNGHAAGNVITGVGTNAGSGSADSYGADGPGQLTTIHSNGTGQTDVSFDPSGNLSVHGSFGTLTIDANGEYTYVRDANSNEAGSEVFTYTIVDGDGDTTTATLTIAIPNVDSIPQIGEAANLSVDEDGLGTANNDNGGTSPSTEQDHGGNATDSNTVNVDFGNDVPANLAGAIAFIDSPGLDTQLTQDGQPITFSIIGGDLVGQVNGAGPAVVTISFTSAVPATGGNVTYGYEVTLSDHIDQAYPDGDNNESGITLTGVQFQVTDSDGDHAPTPGSFNVDIYDDVPSAGTPNQEGVGHIVVDESPIGHDAGGDSDPVGVRSADADYSGLFAAPVVGADGPGTTTYDLNLSSEGAGSGLFALGVDGAKGDEIQLYTDGDNIVGKIGSEVYFTISVTESGTGAGTVTFTQEDGANVWHADAANFDDTSSLVADAGTIELNQTITDSDGDQASASLDLSNGVFQIEDDGPVAVGDTNTVIEGDTLTVVAADGVLNNDDFGTDGPGTIVGVAAGDDTSSPVSGNVGTEITGDYGKLTLDADGGYKYVSTDGAVPPAGAHDVFVYTIVDADGDTSTVTLDITLDNNNQIPVAGEANAAVDDEGLANGIPGDISNGDIDANAGESGAGASDEHIFTGQLQGSGGDAPTGFLFDAALDGTTATVGTETVTYQVSGDGQTLTATISDGDRTGTELFTVVINDAAGDFTLTLSNPVMHTFGDGTEASVTLDIPYQMTDLDNDSSALPGTLHVEFNDDVPTAGTPDQEALGHIVVDESPVGYDEGGDNDPAGLRSAGTDFSGHFTGGAYGADGAGSTVYDLNLSSEGAGSGLFALGVDGAKGDEIQLYTDGDTIVGKVGSELYFTISVTASGTGAGTVTFTQEDGENVWHANTGSDDDTSSLIASAGTVELSQTITDADGDQASASLDLSNGVFQIEDDGPTGGTPDQEDLGHIVVDESPVGQDEGGDNDPAGVRSAGADFSGHFTGGGYGTDGPGTTSYDLSLSSEGEGSGLFALGVDGAKGDEIQLYTDGDNIVGKIGSELYFTISVNTTGTVTFTQEDGENVWHANTGSDDDTSSLVASAGTIELTQTITDADGDHANGSLDLSNGIFQIEDDGPTAGTPDQEPLGHIVVDESPVGQDEGGDSDPAGVRSAGADFSGHFSGGGYGTDGPGTTAYDLSLSSEGEGSGLFALGVDGAKGDEIQLYTDGDNIVGKIGSEVYFTISVTASGTGAGTVTFTQEDGENVWHADTGSDDDTSSLVATAGTIELNQTITDADGDQASASLDLSNGVFQIEDDGPTTFTPDAAELENDSGSITGVSLDTGDGDLTDNYGTDGPGTVRFGVTEGADSGLTSGGMAILYHLSADGLTLSGYVDDGQHGGFQGGEDDTIFTITLNPGSSTYDVAMDGHVDAHSTIDFNDGSYDFVGGNDPWAGFVPTGQIDFKANNTPVDDNSNDLLLTPFSSGTDGDSINGNANSAGVGGGGGGQNIGSGEGIRLDFVTDLVGNPAGSPSNYDGNVAQQDHHFDNHYDVNDVSVKFGDGATDTTIRIEAYNNTDSALDDHVLGVGDEVNITNIFISYDGEKQEFAFDPLHPTDPQTLTVGNGNNADGHADRSYTVTWIDDGSGVYHVEVTGILDTNVRIATHGETDYQALEIEYKSGDDFAVTGFGAVAVTDDPVTFHVPVEIVDADGDPQAGDPLSITLDPVGSLSTLSTFAAQSSLSNEGFKTALFSSNDNNNGKQGEGNSTVLTAAVAAAGLSTAHSAAAHGSDGPVNNHDSHMLEKAGGADLAPLTAERHESHDRADHALDAAPGAQHEAVVSRTPVHDQAQSQSHAGGEHHQPAQTELLQATAGAAHGGGAHGAHFAAQGISMPSAEQMASLAAPAESAKAPEAGQQGQHNEVVGKILADALHGGGHGHNIDHLLDAASGSHGGHGHANAALEALASQGGGAVPFGHMSFAASFHGGAMLPMMDALAVHQDAAPTHG